MKNNLLICISFFIGFSLLGSGLNPLFSKTKTVELWQVANKTYDTETKTIIYDFPISSDIATFVDKENTYQSASLAILGVNERMYKLGGGELIIPKDCKITGLTVYGWSRYANRDCHLSSLVLDGKTVSYTASTSPYMFNGLPADPSGSGMSSNRTLDNITTHSIKEISAENPLTQTFKLTTSSEVHGFYKITMEVPDNSQSGEITPIPAFPGAEGGGMYTTGGRGGVVYYVNTLEDNTSGSTATREGSLRWCLNQEGPKTILFKVAGTILLNSELKITKGDLTLAGQSAPGQGICIGNYPVSIAANNIIIRYLRFRMGDDASAEADAVGGRFFTNVIVDHCSMSWSTDECVSFYACDYFTLQWCLISESLRMSAHEKGAHGYGGIWGGNNATFHHNLLAHHSSRTPRFGPDPAKPAFTEKVDHRNNVNYNYGNTYGGEGMEINIINNYYKPGPVTLTGAGRGRIISFDKTEDPNGTRYNVWGRLFVDGNVIDTSTSQNNADITACRNATNDNWTYGVYNQFHSSHLPVTNQQKADMKLDVPLEIKGLYNSTEVPVTVTTHTAQKAYDKVVQYVGASYKRDSYDARVLDEVINGTTHFKGSRDPNNKPGIIDTHWDIKPAGADEDWTPWPILASSTVPVDSNRDGIPDGWLETNYPGKSANDLNEDGYTYLEVYLNSLVEEITNKQYEEAISNVADIPTGLFGKLIVTKDAIAGGIRIVSDESLQQISLYNLSGILIREIKAINDNQLNISLNSAVNDAMVLVRAVTSEGKVLVSKCHLL